ncbi:MAG: SDR family oxidoreductase [Novosphingobium sp.]|nr:SDR family oxidoreductase [Novosphingobium sp.]
MLNILVTGAAGLVGGEVCAQLCRDGHQVTALVHRNRNVRGNDGAQVPVAGIIPVDVTLPQFGHDDANWSRLAEASDVLIHCAAVTRFDLPEAEYRKVNIVGTAYAIELARCAGLNLLHVSTAYVCGVRDGLIREIDPLPESGFANAYETSKAAAEQLVRASGLPFVIVRPSIIVGDSRTGAIRDFETTYAVFKAIAEGRIGSLPFRKGATLDFVPIDHVASSISALSVQFPRVARQTAHLVSGQPITVEDFVAAIGDFPQFHVPELVEAQDFDPGQLLPLERRLFIRLAGPYASYFRRDPRFDASGLHSITGKVCPATDAAWLRGLIRYCISRGFLPDDELSEYRDRVSPAACARPMPTSPLP